MAPSTFRRFAAVAEVESKKVSVVSIDGAQLDQLTADDMGTTTNRRIWEEKQYFSRHDSAWYGGLQSRADAHAIFRNGWPEGAAKAAAARDEVSDVIPHATSRKRVRRFSDDGSDIRIDQALAGDWDAAYESRTVIQAPSDRTVSITCGFQAMCDKSAEEIMWNAVQALVLTDVLESSGYRVELRAVDVLAVPTGLHVADILLKAADMPADADTIAAVVGHAGIYRTFGFDLMTTQPTDTNSSLGRECGEYTRTKAIAAAVEANAISPISYRIPRADSRAAALANIQTALHALGAVVEETV